VVVGRGRGEVAGAGGDGVPLGERGFGAGAVGALGGLVGGGGFGARAGVGLGAVVLAVAGGERGQADEAGAGDREELLGGEGVDVEVHGMPSVWICSRSNSCELDSRI